jgi:hypothetical protein
MSNKAHTATLRRIAKRYAGTIGTDGQADITAGDVLIEVETAATIAEGIHRLQSHAGKRYVAVTNQETIVEALRMTAQTGIGVMNPQGDIVREGDQC